MVLYINSTVQNSYQLYYIKHHLEQTCSGIALPSSFFAFPIPYHACHARLLPAAILPLAQKTTPPTKRLTETSLNQTDRTQTTLRHSPRNCSPLKLSPPPQNNPPSQNLQPHHRPDRQNPPPYHPLRPSLNNQRSPAPRIRDRWQIVALRDDRSAESTLLHDSCCRVVISNSTSYVLGRSLRSCPGGCGGGCDVLRSRLVGVAAREGALAVPLESGAAADLFVVGVLAEGVGGAAAGREEVSMCCEGEWGVGFRKLTILLRRWNCSFVGSWLDIWRSRLMLGLVVGCRYWRRLLLGRCLRRMFALR